jgi:hypothetical protein
VKRDDLLPKGDYAALPLAVLAMRKLSPGAKLVYAALLRRLGDGRVEVWPGANTLQRETGLSRRGVQKALGRLLTGGLVSWRSRGSPDGTNLYEFTDWRRKCASAQNAPLLAHKMRGGSARNAPKLLKGTTQGNYSRTARGGRAATPDPRIKVFIDWFCATYKATLGRDYVVVGAKDGATIKRLLRSLSPDELQRAARNMLADSWGKDRASIGLLGSQINTWRGEVKQSPAGRPGTFTPAQPAAGYGNVGRRFA